MSTAQELLDLLNQANISSLFDPNLDKKGRTAATRLVKQKIRHIKQLLKQEKDIVKARWDNRNKEEALIEQLELLPLLAVERVVSKVEVQIAELQAAVDTGSPLPEPIKLGQVLVKRQDDQSIEYLMVDAATAQQMEEEEQKKREAEQRAAAEQERAAMLKAQALIRNKEYAAAKEVLEKIDNAKAKEWLHKVNIRLTAELLAPAKTVSAFAAKPVAMIKLVCPKCKEQATYEQDQALRGGQFKCVKCKTSFFSQVYRIRAKSTQQDKSSGRRGYSIRVIDNFDREDLIQFVDSYYNPQIELRSRDVAVFTYLNKKLVIVQNLTLNLYFVVSNPSCYLATHVYGPNSSEVYLLRKFRDDMLIPSPILTHLVTLYYRASPLLVQQWGNSELFKFVTVKLLTPVLVVMQMRSRR